MLEAGSWKLEAGRLVARRLVPGMLAAHRLVARRQVPGMLVAHRRVAHKLALEEHSHTLAGGPSSPASFRILARSPPLGSGKTVKGLLATTKVPRGYQ